jgi:hypothetical protein
VVVGALLCAAPTCDTHDGAIGSGSGSSAWSRMPSPSAAAPAETAAPTQHEDMVRAASSAKPAKKRTATSRSGDSSSNSPRPSSPPPPKKPELPERGRTLGQHCETDYQCSSDKCEFQLCTQKSGTKLPNGEKCDRNSVCASNDCFVTCQ